MAEQTYLDRFPSFEQDPEATLIENFERLAISEDWAKNSRKFKEEKRIYMVALADTHIESIDRGGAAEKLAGLQGLCEELGVSPIPTSITQCKKQLKTVNVCLVDLIDSRRRRTPAHVFGSHLELQRHVIAQKHYFPRVEAKKAAGGLLKILLRWIQGQQA